MDASWQPRPAPSGVVPVGLIAKITSPHRKKRGRPRMVTPSASDDEPEKSEAGEASEPPVAKDSAPASHEEQKPTRTPKRSRAKDTGEILPVTISVPTPKTQPWSNDSLDRAYTDWVAKFHSTPDHRLVGDMAQESGSDDDGSDADMESDSEFEPCRTPNILVLKEPLRRMRKPLTQDDGYEEKQIRISKLVRFFDQLDMNLNLVSHAVTDAVRFKWIDGPGFRPSDVRARRLEMHVSSGFARKNPDQRVWRVKYRCNGSCTHHIQGEGEKRPPPLATKDQIEEELLAFAAPAAKRFELRSKAADAKTAKTGKTAKAAKAAKTAKTENATEEKSRTGTSTKRKNIDYSSDTSEREGPTTRLRRRRKQVGGGGRKREAVADSEALSSDEGDNIFQGEDRTRRSKAHYSKIVRKVIGSSDSEAEDQDTPSLSKDVESEVSPTRYSVKSKAKPNAEDDVYDPEDSDTSLEYDDDASDSWEIDPEKVAEEDSDSASSVSEDIPKPKGKKNGHAHRCQSHVVIEMTAEQCRRGRCTVIVQRPEWHPATPKHRLRCSRYLRRTLHEAALGFGMTPGRLSAWYAQHILKFDAHAKWLSTRFKHRMPRRRDYTSAVIAASKTDRVHRSPLTAIEILASRNPESFIAANYPTCLEGDIKAKQINKDTRLECVIAPRWAQMAAIVQVARMGMYLDSSWRNKNAFRCPLTFLVTINQYHRMIPLAAMVSNHADAAAYQFMLSEFAKAVQQTAKDFMDGKFDFEMEGVDPEELREQCAIVAEDGLAPCFMMIDGSDPERIAIEEVFGCPVRCCQFHLMQACRSRVRRMFNRTTDAELLVSNVLEAIRKCQRCPEESQWDEYYAALGAEVTRIKQDDGEAWQELKEYLDKEWFSDRWRESCVDYGLPFSVITRDGPWSTNNYSEASFRTFDRIFLGCRANKRLDRLIAVLINTYFPFYENIPLDESRADPMLQRQLFRGLHRWETDCIHPCAASSVPEAHSSLFGDTIYCVNPARRGKSSYQPHFCGRRPGNERETCTCGYPQSTGKRCLHLWAMVQYELCGSVACFEENASRIYAFIKRATVSSPPEHADVDAYSQDRRDFKEYWGKDITRLPKLTTIDLNTGFSPARSAGKAPSRAIIAPVTPTPIRSKPAPPPRETSPIGRRYAVNNDGIRQASEDRDDPRAWSHSLPGRPATVRPLNPGRAHTKQGKSDPVGMRKFRTILPAASDKHHSRPPQVKKEPHTDLPNAAAVEITVRGESSGFKGHAPSETAATDLDLGSHVPDPHVEDSRPLASPSAITLPKVQKSSLSLVRRKPVQRTLDVHRPVGIVNTGLDCYALSLFHVLLRLDAWSRALFNQGESQFEEDPIVLLVRGVRDSLDKSSSSSFPRLRETLANAHLVESSVRQIDPDELLAEMNAYLDRIAGSTTFSRLLQFTIISTIECPDCRTTKVVKDECVVQRSLILPVALQGGTLSVEELVSNSLQVGVERSHTCASAMCSTPFRAHSTSYLVNGPPILHLHFAWPTTRRQGTSTNPKSVASVSAALGEEPVQVDTGTRRFLDVPRHLRIITTFRPGPPPPISYALRGIICRSGQLVSEGHFVAIIGSAQTWWVMDDDRVSHTSSPSDAAFESGRYPIHAFYEIEGSDRIQSGNGGHSSSKAAQLRDRSTIMGPMHDGLHEKDSIPANRTAPTLPPEQYFGGKHALFGKTNDASKSATKIPSQNRAEGGTASRLSGAAHAATGGIRPVTATARSDPLPKTPARTEFEGITEGDPHDFDTPLKVIQQRTFQGASKTTSPAGTMLSFSGVPIQVPKPPPASKRYRSATPEYIDLTRPLTMKVPQRQDTKAALKTGSNAISETDSRAVTARAVPGHPPTFEKADFSLGSSEAAQERQTGLGWSNLLTSGAGPWDKIPIDLPLSQALTSACEGLQQPAQVQLDPKTNQPSPSVIPPLLEPSNRPTVEPSTSTDRLAEPSLQQPVAAHSSNPSNDHPAPTATIEVPPRQEASKKGKGGKKQAGKGPRAKSGNAVHGQKETGQVEAPAALEPQSQLDATLAPVPPLETLYPARPEQLPPYVPPPRPDQWHGPMPGTVGQQPLPPPNPWQSDQATTFDAQPYRTGLYPPAQPPESHYSTIPYQHPPYHPNPYQPSYPPNPYPPAYPPWTYFARPPPNQPNYPLPPSQAPPMGYEPRAFGPPMYEPNQTGPNAQFGPHWNNAPRLHSGALGLSPNMISQHSASPLSWHDPTPPGIHPASLQPSPTTRYLSPLWSNPPVAVADTVTPREIGDNWRASGENFGADRDTSLWRAETSVGASVQPGVAGSQSLNTITRTSRVDQSQDVISPAETVSAVVSHPIATSIEASTKIRTTPHAEDVTQTTSTIGPAEVFADAAERPTTHSEIGSAQMLEDLASSDLWNSASLEWLTGAFEHPESLYVSPNEPEVTPNDTSVKATSSGGEPNESIIARKVIQSEKLSAESVTAPTPPLLSDGEGLISSHRTVLDLDAFDDFGDLSSLPVSPGSAVQGPKGSHQAAEEPSSTKIIGQAASRLVEPELKFDWKPAASASLPVRPTAQLPPATRKSPLSAPAKTVIDLSDSPPPTNRRPVLPRFDFVLPKAPQALPVLRALPLDFKSFLASTSLQGIEDAALERYRSVAWASLDDHPASCNLISMATRWKPTFAWPRCTSRFAGSLKKRLQEQSSVQGSKFCIRTTNARTDLSNDDFEYMMTSSEWWNTQIIDAVCLSAIDRLKRAGSPAVERCRLAELFLQWGGAGDSGMEPRLGADSKKANRPPWIALGLDRSWRDVITIAIISVQYQTHFATVAIFGPARLVVVFDGEGGKYDHPKLRKAWTSLLSNRLEWELEHSMVKAEENEGWIFAPNTRTMRDGLGWVQQTDEWNCGPLASAAAIMILQGIQPTASNLGIKGKTSWSSWILLRDSLTILLLGEAIRYGRRLASVKARDANSVTFEQYFTSDPSIIGEFLEFKERYRNLMESLMGKKEEKKRTLDDEDYVDT